MTITSPDNPIIKELRKLTGRHGRSRSTLFAAEGEDLVAAAGAAGWQPERVLVREGSGLEGEEVAADLLDSVSTLGSGTRTIAIYTKRFVASPPPGLIVHLDSISDPGNVGTIIRSAHALGATAASLGEGCADPFGPKAVRASMGSIFAVPLSAGVGPAELEGLKVGLEAGADPGEFPDGDVVIVDGAERAGLSEAAKSACDRLWGIPMVEGAESLNAAVACSLALYSANRIPG